MTHYKEKRMKIYFSTTNWHLPRALLMTEQQRPLPSASMKIEPRAAMAVDLQQSLRDFRVEWGTLCSRESSGTVQSLSHVWLFATPWTAAHQASLSITNSWSLVKLMSIESVMPSNHLILFHPLLLPPSIFPSIRGFSNELVLHIRWPKYWSFSLSISPSNEYSGLISFRIDWLDP